MSLTHRHLATYSFDYKKEIHHPLVLKVICYKVMLWQKRKHYTVSLLMIDCLI